MDEKHDPETPQKRVPEKTLMMVISTAVGFVLLIIAIGWILLANGCYVIGSL